MRPAPMGGGQKGQPLPRVPCILPVHPARGLHVLTAGLLARGSPPLPVFPKPSGFSDSDGHWLAAHSCRGSAGIDRLPYWLRRSRELEEP